MSESDSSSDNESNISEDVNASVLVALEVMKKRMTNCASEPNSTEKPRRYLQKIYETFKTDKNKPANKSVKKDNGSGVPDVCTDFIIDRKAAAKDINVNVETFDLSSMQMTNGDDTVTITEKHKKDKKKKKKAKKRAGKSASDGLSSELKTKISTDDVYINVDPEKDPIRRPSGKQTEQRHKEPEIMKKSVITDDFERQESVPSSHTSNRQKKRERKFEREKTKGRAWHHMPAVELTEEQQTDLKVLQMRKALDPKRFYKGNDAAKGATPKFIQFGKVIETAADFYDSRVPKKQRKATIVEELLADTEFRKYNKRKYEEIQEARRLGKGPYKHMKRLKKRKT